MSLLLTGSRDQALLAMVIEEARRAASVTDGFVGRTAVQKIMYFLRTSGVPMGYRFDLHHYGPYCEGITSDLEWLLADRVLVDRSPDPARYSSYAPGDTAQEILSLHQDNLDPYRADIRRVVEALVPLRPERLELFATLDYVHRWNKASGSAGPWKDRVIARFLEVKGQKFAREDVSQAYDTMVAVGLLDA